jgi:hypothetical protein
MSWLGPVEGDLPQETVDDLTRDVVDKLPMLENPPFELIEL